MGGVKRGNHTSQSMTNMGGVKGEISEKSKLGATHPLLWHNM